MLGAQLYTVRKFTQTIPDIAETLRKIADIGYKTIQISALGPVDLKKVAKLVEDNKLLVVGTHTDWDRLLNKLDDVIAEYKMWGCSHAAIGGLFDPKYCSLKGLKQFMSELGPVSEKLAKEGIDFSYHNHNHELMRYGKKTWLEMLYEQASPEVLKAEIDVYWIQAGGGDPTVWVRKCAGREPLLHLKDMTVGPGRQQRFAEIGEGNMNWPTIIQAAKESGVEWYIVEQDECYERDPFESLAISYHNLQSMGLN
jgi:sugar phosphate isomerase/epimerase